MRKEKIIWKPKRLLSGKYGKSFWKSLDKCKNKEDIINVLYIFAYEVQQLEDRLVELKKHVGDKRKF